MSISQTTFQHCRVRFYAFFGQPFLKLLYVYIIAMYKLNNYFHFQLASYTVGEWEYREVQQDEATQLPVERVRTKHSKKDMFKAELRLIEYPGK